MPSRSSKPTVLLVDDDRAIRESLSEVLEWEGYSVITARNGEEGLEQLKRIKPDIILLDVVMPVMNGWEFRKAQKEDPEVAEIPLFVFCANTRGESAAGIDATGFLSKPVDIDTILEAIAPYTH